MGKTPPLSRRRLGRKERSLLISVLLLIISVYVAAPAKNYLERQWQQSTPPGSYRVSTFYDGDTIAVLMDGKAEKVRFIGVNTPETHDPRKPVECFGQAASDYTKNLITDKPVRLEADPTNTNRDRYGRLLRYVYLPDGTLVNAAIIENGYGFALTAFPFKKMEQFKQLEATAKQANKGLWAACPPL